MKRFGVELEVSGSLPDAVDALRAAGIDVANGLHSHIGFSPTAWTVKRDGTVQSGGEVVTPPLDFDNPDHREQLSRGVQALQDAGLRPHPSAGIHVHIEAKQCDGEPLTARQIAAVVRFTYKFEDAIYRIASSGWESMRPGARTYAGPIPENVARAIMEVKTMDELTRVWDGHNARPRATRYRRGHSGNISAYEPQTRSAMERYHGTNLRAFWSKGTIEFRYFNSSVNPDRVQAYVALCMAIVDDARNGFSRSVAKHYPIGSMLRGTVKPEALMLRLQQILRSDSRDTKVCMTAADWKNLRKICWNCSVPQGGAF